MKIDPIKTCNPWKPVSMKNTEPKLESLIEKNELWYSFNWNRVKVKPKIKVNIKNIIDFFILFFVKQKCLKVIVNPEVNKISVLIIGISLYSNINKFLGGQNFLISINGLNKKWK